MSKFPCSYFKTRVVTFCVVIFRVQAVVTFCVNSCFVTFRDVTFLRKLLHFAAFKSATVAHCPISFPERSLIKISMTKAYYVGCSVNCKNTVFPSKVALSLFPLIMISLP